MPTYEFRCGTCGPFERVVPMSETAVPQTCAVCGVAAGRVFSAPGVRRTAPDLAHALDAQCRSRDEPAVVTKVPRRPVPPPPGDPRHARLPRP